jgi:DNA-binding NarL/FixJ family response regulator
VSEGDAVLSPAVARRLVDRFMSRPPRRVEQPESSGLSPRELDVWRAIARGLSNAEIGRELFISEATVKTHVARVLAKLELRDRSQAIIAAYERGLVSPGT